MSGNRQGHFPTGPPHNPLLRILNPNEVSGPPAPSMGYPMPGNGMGQMGEGSRMGALIHLPSRRGPVNSYSPNTPLLEGQPVRYMVDTPGISPQNMALASSARANPGMDSMESSMDTNMETAEARRKRIAVYVANMMRPPMGAPTRSSLVTSPQMQGELMGANPTNRYVPPELTPRDPAIDAQVNTGFPSSQSNTGFPSCHSNTGLKSNQPNPDFPNIQSNTGVPSSPSNTGFPSSRSNTEFSTSQSNTGFRNIHSISGYTSSQSNTDFPSSQSNPGFPSSPSNAGFPSSPSNTSFPNSQSNTGFPSSESNTDFPSCQNSGGFSSSQPNTVIPGSHSKPDFPSSHSITSSLNSQSNTGFSSGESKSSNPSSYSNTGFPSSQSNTGFPSNQSNTGFPSSPSNNGFPNRQSNKCIPSGESVTDIPNSLSNTNFPSGQSNPSFLSSQSNTGFSSPNSFSGVSQVTPALNHQQQPIKEYNTASLCRFGQETVQDIVSRTQEVFQMLKMIRPPNGTVSGEKNSEDKKAKVQEQLRSINLLFKRLRLIYEKCDESCPPEQGFTDVEDLIPFEDDEEPNTVGEEKKTSVSYKVACQEKKELIDQITVKNLYLKEVIDNLRNIIWRTNVMLTMHK